MNNSNNFKYKSLKSIHKAHNLGLLIFFFVGSSTIKTIFTNNNCTLISYLVKHDYLLLFQSICKSIKYNNFLQLTSFLLPYASLFHFIISDRLDKPVIIIVNLWTATVNDQYFILFLFFSMKHDTFMHGHKNQRNTL